MLTAAVLAALACLAWPVRARGEPVEGVRGTVGSRGRTTAPRWVARVLARRRARSPGAAAGSWVADFAEVVAVGLEAGLDLPRAALASARSPGVLALAPWLAAHLETCVDRGTGVGDLLGAPTVARAEWDEPCLAGRGGLGPAERVRLADEDRRDLALLATAWRLTEGTGAAASAVTASAAASVRERRAAADRTAVVVAGPRASMVLLSALPLTGPLAALAVGVPPSRLYDSPAARVMGLTGLLMTLIGWWWARWLLQRAGRPGRTDGGPG